MKKTLLSLMTGAVFALTASWVQAAFIVDDFNTTTSYACSDPGVSGDYCAPTNTPIDDGNTVWGDSTAPHTGITRELGATLSAGDGIATEICSNCQTAHLVASVGGTGDYWLVWTGPEVDLSGGILAFNWGADVAGTTWYADFGDATGVVINTVDQAALPSTGTSDNLIHNAFLDLSTITGVDLTRITQISLHFSGVENLDASIDNVQVKGVGVPEPAAFTLMVLGIAAIGLARKQNRV